MDPLNFDRVGLSRGKHFPVEAFSTSFGAPAAGLPAKANAPRATGPMAHSGRGPDIGIVLLEVVLPGRRPSLGGFILLDHIEKRAYVRARDEWASDLDPTDFEVLSSTREVIESFFDEAGFEGGQAAVNELSSAIRSTDEFPLSLADPPNVAADQIALHLFGC